MKKRITQKVLATVAVACLMIGGVFAQTHNGTTIPGAIANYAGSDAQPATYITEGTTVPMWVSPDAYFHPNYVPGTDYTLTDGFTWTFSGTATTGLTVTQAATDDNYVTVSAAAGDAGAYTLSVTENAPAAFGGCSGPAQNLAINVVAAPSVALASTTAISACETNTTAFPANINAVISGGWQNFRLAWNLQIATLNTSGTKEFYYNTDGTGQNAVAFNAVDHTTTTFSAIAASGNYDLMANDNLTAFTAFNNGTRDAVTVYTYTLIGINDQASRFGNYIALGGDDTDPSAFTYYPATSTTLVVTVYPAPVTGPIYHINNTWAQ